MKVVLFGGNGYIGQQVIKKLLPNAQISIVSRSRTSIAGTKAIMGNIGDKRSVADCIKDADVVANFVGIMEANNQSFDLVQVQGPASIVEALQSHQRLVHISALGIEAQVTDYQRTKLQGEQAILNKGQNVLVIRSGLVIGEQDKFMNRFAKLLRLFPLFPLFGGGNALYQPIYVENLAAIIANAINNHSNGSSLVEVGGPDVVQFRELIARACRWHSQTGWQRMLTPPFLFPLPVGVALIQGKLMESLIPVGSDYRVTQDQIKMLQQDNKVSNSTIDKPELIHILQAEDSDVKTKLMKDVQFKKLDDLYKDGRWAT